jgi:2-hydroxy-3-keto-5-methylthiopentenyl-1-phosphate phosphatase
MRSKKFLFVSDFDGTLTAKDVGYQLFSHFSGGRNKDVIRQWKERQLSTRDCLRKEASLIRASLSDIWRYLENFQLAAGLPEFYRAARKANLPFFIVSEGIDVYLDYILKKFGLGEIPYFCNHAIIQDNRMTVEFPYDNGSCSRCGCCKGARIRDLVKQEGAPVTVIFAGDGLSDVCALPESDIVFARGDLWHYCQSINKEAIKYKDFFDILQKTTELGIT